MAYRFEPGQVIGGFRLDEHLHQGGMATLWRVTHPDHSLRLIMKIPLLGWGEEAGNIVSFEAEQMILPRLSGPHVPRFIAADFSEQPYLVMELIQGSSLKPHLERLPLPVAEVAALGARVATALHAVHRQQVNHLDLKPSNVMIRPSGEAVLIDFGLSRHDQLPDLLAEATLLPVGTAPYIAPEQVLGIRTDPRSDLFALGVMLYFFTTGERPFGIPSSRRKLRARLYRDPRPPASLRPDCPPWLQEVILRCLEVDPAERYQSGAQLAFALQNPEQVHLTGRASRARRDPLRMVMRRWAGGRQTRAAPPPTISAQLARAPIILAAVDLTPEMEDLAEALRITVRRILDIEPGARLACVNVLKTSRLSVDILEDSQGRNLHVQRLVELRAWARPLGLTADRVSFHVIEAPDPAAALLEYVGRNDVDHVVIGARGSSPVRRYLGSVSSQVVAEAPCSVTVVRVREIRTLLPTVT